MQCACGARVALLACGKSVKPGRNDSGSEGGGNLASLCVDRPGANFISPTLISALLLLRYCLLMLTPDVSVLRLRRVNSHKAASAARSCEMEAWPLQVLASRSAICERPFDFQHECKAVGS